MPVAMVAWPAVLITAGTGSELSVITGGALIAVPNVALGVGLIERPGISGAWPAVLHNESQKNIDLTVANERVNPQQHNRGQTDSASNSRARVPSRSRRRSQKNRS